MNIPGLLLSLLGIIKPSSANNSFDFQGKSECPVSLPEVPTSDVCQAEIILPNSEPLRLPSRVESYVGKYKLPDGSDCEIQFSILDVTHSDGSKNPGFINGVLSLIGQDGKVIDQCNVAAHTLPKEDGDKIHPNMSFHPLGDQDPNKCALVAFRSRDGSDTTKFTVKLQRS